MPYHGAEIIDARRSLERFLKLHASSRAEPEEIERVQREASKTIAKAWEAVSKDDHLGESEKQIHLDELESMARQLHGLEQ